MRTFLRGYIHLAYVSHTNIYTMYLHIGTRKPCKPVQEIFMLGTTPLISTALLYPEGLMLLPGGL